MKDRKKTLPFLFCLVLSYGCVVMYLYQTQRGRIFFPDAMPPDPLVMLAQSMEPVNAATEDGLALQGWFRPPPPGSKKPVIVMFHGNAGNIANRLYKAQTFIDAGYGFMLAEYRGYGGNPGTPSEKGFYSDGRAYLAWLREAGYAPSRIVLYGESIGSGTAAQMAIENKGFKALILETPFSSLVDVAQARMFFVPVSPLMLDRFENARKLSDVQIPKLILHATDDRVIPYRFALKLFNKAADPKRMETFLAGGHNDLYSQGAAHRILNFLRDVDEGKL